MCEGGQKQQTKPVLKVRGIVILRLSNFQSPVVSLLLFTQQFTADRTEIMAFVAAVIAEFC